MRRGGAASGVASSPHQMRTELALFPRTGALHHSPTLKAAVPHFHEAKLSAERN